MFNLEYKQSRGCASEHQFHHNIVDMYILYKNGHKVFSERADWHDYYFILEINNLDKEIRLLKRAIYHYDSNFYKGCYAIKYEDCVSIIDDLTIYINSMKEMLDIQDYKMKLYC